MALDTLAEKIAVARRIVPEVDPGDAKRRISRPDLAIVDVREVEEWGQGHLPGARLLPIGDLEWKIEREVPDRSAEILLYCASGIRSLLAGQTLKALGYTNVSSLAGGIRAWLAAGGEIVTDGAESGLAPDQNDRYSRHLLLPQVGLTGQRTLIRSKVLVVGAGGLGSPVALYLGAAGVGTIGIVDNDRVERSNLQRQILYDTPGIGRGKAESARDVIGRLNPDVRVEAHSFRLDASNVYNLMEPYDIVVDGVDNFETRYLLNDACHFMGKPMVYGSVFRFEGQVSILHTKSGGPCYRCIFPQTEDGASCPNCAEAGVLGVLPGAIGMIQATETLKWLLGTGETLIGRLLLYDALGMRFTELRIGPDPECLLCGRNPTLTRRGAPSQ